MLLGIRVVLTALVLTVMPPLTNLASVYAASCCGGASSASAFVLPKLKRALVGTGIRTSVDWDARTSSGAKLGLTSYSNREFSLIVGGSVRVHRDIQVGVSLPMTVRNVVASGLHETGAMIGDLGMQLRYELMDEETCFLVPIRELSWHDMKPSIHLVVNSSLPTGRSANASLSALGADVTGLGYWLVDVGLEITKVWGRFGNHVAATVGHQWPAQSGIGLTSAWRFGVDASASWFWDYRRSIGLLVSHRRQHFDSAVQTTTNPGTFVSALFDNNWFVRASATAVGVAGRQTPIGAVAAATVGYIW